jgi:hypothetical protein
MRYIDSPDDVAHAVRALVDGAVVATAFGNVHAVVTNPSAAIVRRVNLATGRPVDQIVGITTAAPRIPGMFDWGALSPGLSEATVRALMDTLYARGPFGFRGPAARQVPDHLTRVEHGVRTTQVIAPGSVCPSNVLFDKVARALGDQPLYLAAEEPADLAPVPDPLVLAHRDEAVARAAYPNNLPIPVTVLSFHAPVTRPDGRPVLTVERHGSLSIVDVARIARPLGFDVVPSPAAGQSRSTPRNARSTVRLTSP